MSNILAKNYKELEIYKRSFNLFIQTHRFSFKMPKSEVYELGSQIRRSADSVNSNIVEGYGRKRYKNDFIKLLTYSHLSNDETINHLQKIRYVYPELNSEAEKLIKEYDLLGGNSTNSSNTSSKIGAPNSQPLNSNLATRKKKRRFAHLRNAFTEIEKAKRELIQRNRKIN